MPTYLIIDTDGGSNFEDKSLRNVGSLSVGQEDLPDTGYDLQVGGDAKIVVDLAVGGVLSVTGTGSVGGAFTAGGDITYDGKLVNGLLTLLTSLNVLQNVTADAGIITSGTFPVAQGGTGKASLDSGHLVLGAGTSDVTLLDPGDDGGFVKSASGAWTRSTIVTDDLPDHTHDWDDITGEPTTLAGYGITDAASSTHTHNLVDLEGDLPASRIDAGTFGTGNYTFNGNVTATAFFEA